jgi:hypothetical protein
MVRTAQPDFLIVGAPKAGTSALHAALALHPDIFMTTPKEPKYWLCDDAPPPHWGGPGDRHSQQEWVWRRNDYEALFHPAGPRQLRGESTPFYLWSRSAQRRIAENLPDVKLVVVVRDPIDRAYSNWMHLWCEGLEPVSGFLDAFGKEEERIRRGYAPFWRYRELGLYGEQVAHLYQYVDPDRVLIVRYRRLVDDPAGAVDKVARFLGVREGQVAEIPRDNSRTFVEPGWRPRILGPAVRAGFWAGQFAPPEVWRTLQPHATRHLSGRRGGHRPRLTPEQRSELLPAFADDIKLLASVTGGVYDDWLSTRARGSFLERAEEGGPEGR